ncbi:MAG TPA: HDOD domain-containing protein [Rhodocyclaceae bacterium]|nr:HDOD domain-containing protein [Rhodocyclaceae bacterium]
MNPAVFELAVSADGVATPGYGVLAAFVPASAGLSALVVAGCDPRRDPGRPIEGLAGPAFDYINRKLGQPADLRWVIVDNWGRFFEALPHWSADADMPPVMEFRRFPGGIGVDAYANEMGAVGEVGLEMLSTVIEGGVPEGTPASARQFLDAIESHGNLPAPGALFHAVSTAAVTGDINTAVKAIQTDPMISATLINYANAAAFANAGRTASVAEAIQRLGMNQVRRVVFIAEMMARYQKGICPNFDYRAYWHNAVATAAAMRGLMEKFEIPGRLADEGFTVGLVSGIGWLAIAETFPSLMSSYISQSRGHDVLTKARLQKDIFPAPLNQVTETYLARFEFPETVRSAITRAPIQDGWAWFDCLASAVRVAQALAPLEYLAIPTNIPVPDSCREEWQHWQSLLAFSN